MKKKPTASKGVNCTSSCNDKVILISKELNFKSSDEGAMSNVEIISLRQPRTQESAQFLYDSDKGTLQECWNYSEKCRSWFIGNSICSQGTVLICTDVDPLFLILPYFLKSQKYRVFDEIVHDDDFTDSSKLECLVDEKQLSIIADKKDCNGLIVWKYNNEKTLTWLTEKVKRVSDVLKCKKLNVNTSCAVSKNFVKSSTESDHEYLRYSHGIVSEYLDSDLSAKLLNHLNLPTVDLGSKKRKNNSLNKDEIKRIKQECHEKEILEKELANDVKAVKKNAKHVALAKAAVGSKSISSFFKKK